MNGCNPQSLVAYCGQGLATAPALVQEGEGATLVSPGPTPGQGKFWGILYRESPCSTARLELFEGSAPPAAEKLRKSEGSKRLVKLSDCVHVAEVGGDAGCPKETIPFLLETTDKRFLLAAEGTEAADWIQKLCELAFPVTQPWGIPGARWDPWEKIPMGMPCCVL
uniref:Uncharacterized protein n=1 Tax=Calidris pygmaea TaxID=425635 RepID=A0A8C3JBI0_9CHAR